MSLIESTRTINANAVAVFQAARQVERFPDVMPDLNSVTVLEDDDNGNTVTRWEGTVAVGPIKRGISWTERDCWDEENLVCTFDLVEGDMKKYSGSWSFKQTGDACEVALTVDFELGIPMLGPMVNSIVDRIMQDNCDALLKALDELSAG